MDKASVAWCVALGKEIEASEEKLIAEVGSRCVREDGGDAVLGECGLGIAKGKIAEVGIRRFGAKALIADLLVGSIGDREIEPVESDALKAQGCFACGQTPPDHKLRLVFFEQGGEGRCDLFVIDREDRDVRIYRQRVRIA